MKILKLFFSTFLIFLFISPINTPFAMITQNKNSTRNLDYNEKTIYLTFDDGPEEPVTSDILNILKEKEVKATFFLIGNLVEKNPELVKRLNDEGHALGLHTFTHERNLIYKNNNSFLEENLKTQKAIENIIDKKVFLLRFPFGSNNSTYTLTKSMVELLHQNKFKIYDWTVDSTDGLNPKLSPDSILRKSISKDPNIVLLMHCGNANKNSAKALPSIIDYFKNLGYSFKIIDENTKEIYRLKNKG